MRAYPSMDGKEWGCLLINMHLPEQELIGGGMEKEFDEMRNKLELTVELKFTWGISLSVI